MTNEFLEIPPGQLNPETLQAVIEEFITREGTDYGHREYALAQKVEQVRRQLDSGAIVLIFDTASETCTLMAKEEFAFYQTR